MRTLLAVLLSASALVHTSALAAPTFADDLEVVKRDYLTKSLAFSEQDRQQALAYIESIKNRSASMTKPEQMAALLRIGAFAHNGHDWLNNGAGWLPDLHLPVRVLWLADGMTVAQAAPGYERLLGGEILSIAGKRPDELLATLRQYNGGTDDFIRTRGIWLVESPQLLKAMGVTSRADRVQVRVRRTDGVVEVCELQAITSKRSAHDESSLGVWSRVASTKQRQLGWKTASASAEPFYLQEPARTFRMHELPQLDALYVQFRSNLDGPNESIAAFAQAVHDKLASTAMHHVILDQRFNTGGNSDITMDLMREIGQHSKGRVYVLVGPRTFSAGIVSTALVKHASGNRAILVGEETGDRLRWWSEGDRVCLPSSKYCMAYTTGLWDLVKGCAGEPGCYGDRFDAVVPHLSPDLRAPVTRAAWLSGTDLAMEAVERDLARNR